MNRNRNSLLFFTIDNGFDFFYKLSVFFFCKLIFAAIGT